MRLANYKQVKRDRERLLGARGTVMRWTESLTMNKEVAPQLSQF